MKLQITIDDKQYEADIEVLEEERHDAPVVATRPSPHRGGPIAPAPVVASSSSVSDDKACRSSIVGIIVSVLVEVGMEVNAGDPLLVLEAMKMESTVISPTAGRVKAICVAPGESVKKDQVLVEFE